MDQTGLSTNGLLTGVFGGWMRVAQRPMVLGDNLVMNPLRDWHVNSSGARKMAPCWMNVKIIIIGNDNRKGHKVDELMIKRKETTDL